VTHLSYADVASTLALVVALSGGAYAVTQLPDRSVGTAQLKNGAVTSNTTCANNPLVEAAQLSYVLLADRG